MKKQIFFYGTIFSSAILVPYALAQNTILCKSNEPDSQIVVTLGSTKTFSSKTEVVVTLNSFKKFGRIFNCIDGEFVFNLSGCAPDGAFGLHRSTGKADLTRVVDRWQDYSDYIGTITSNGISDNVIYFSGASNSPIDGYIESWSYSISRVTGNAQLKTKDKVLATYQCAKVYKKF
jgi:hypothetical protein